MEVHALQDLGDFTQALASEVLVLEHVRLGLADQVADRLDVGHLEAVVRTHRELELVDVAQELIINELEKIGFADPAKAYTNLLAVRDGEVYAPPSPKRLKVMRTLGPALITEIAKSAAPDQALLNLSKFSHCIGGRTGFLTLLAENPETMRLLITLFANSQFLTDLFLNRPELIDTLEREGKSEWARTLRGYWETKVDRFVNHTPNLYGSEFAFDSTGFESTGAFAKYAMTRNTPDFRARVTSEAALKFMNLQLLLNTSDRGWLERLALAYKERRPVRVEDDLGVGIDPARQTVFDMARQAKLTVREWTAVGVSLGLSGAGILPRLPWPRAVLLLISFIFMARGAIVILDILRLILGADYPIRQTVFSLVALVIGLILLTGTITQWQAIGASRPQGR